MVYPPKCGQSSKRLLEQFFVAAALGVWVSAAVAYGNPVSARSLCYDPDHEFFARVFSIAPGDYVSDEDLKKLETSREDLIEGCLRFAERGDRRAQGLVSLFYEDPLFQRQDLRVSLKWAERAAENGDVLGAQRMARYAEGPAEQFRWNLIVLSRIATWPHVRHYDERPIDDEETMLYVKRGQLAAEQLSLESLIRITKEVYTWSRAHPAKR